MTQPEETPYTAAVGAPDQATAPQQVDSRAQANTLPPLPFDTFLISSQERKVIDMAAQQRVAACMRDQGFPDFRPLEASNDTGQAIAESRRYGITNAIAAKHFGYDLPTKPQPSQKIPAEQSLALKDCSQSAANEFVMGADGQPINHDLTLRAGEVFNQSVEDPRVTSAIKHWAECLKRKGFTVKDPLEDDDPVGAKGIPQAVADVECKHSTGLIVAWHAVESELQQRDIDKDPFRFDTARKAKEGLIRKAEAVTNGKP